jgi:hypothetical protein
VSDTTPAPPETGAEPPPDGGELDGGNYEVIRARLEDLGKRLRAQAEALNGARKETFGSTELVVVGNERVRTENNCLPRDIANVGGQLLFGYNVHIGLKSETRLEDVLALHRFGRREGAGEPVEGADEASPGGFELAEVGLDALPGLRAEALEREFSELYHYYKDARLTGVRTIGGKLLAVFQTGERRTDVRVFRWSLDPQRRPTYVDNRGERDNVFPPPHDFEWTPTSREQHVHGRHPHVNLLDEVFVETVGGDLTVKVEDNTEDGLGIYREPVDDPNQSLDDARIDYARVGVLVLFRVRPYREEAWRHFVFNTRTQTVARIDAIEQSCVSLPEDHGIIFPGGYYLQSGAYKVFENEDTSDLVFERSIRAPNGEDVLYIFHHLDEGSYVLLPYNLIRKEVQNPIHAHGWSLFEDGTLVVFRSTTHEPSRVHPMQIWQTPFVSDTFAASAPQDDSPLGRIGNAELVRGISDSLSVARAIADQEPSRRIYEDLIAAVRRASDAYYWLGRPEALGLQELLHAVRDNAELIIDEFEKVLVLRKRAEDALQQAEEAKLVLERDLRPENWRSVAPFMKALSELRTQRGHLITLKDVRYIDVAKIEELEAEVVEHFDQVSKGAVEFLLKDEALSPISARLDGLLEKTAAVVKTSDLPGLVEELEETSDGLSVLTEVMGSLEVDDPTKRTQVLEGISEVFAHLNRTRATLQNKREELLQAEGQAEFGAQFRLFAQAVSNALALCDTPEACDEQLSRLMLQLEELEGRFSEFDAFLADLTEKREEVYEAFDARRQTLVDARQRRAQNLWNAAERILQGVQRRAGSFAGLDELNAYFAADAMILKLRQLAEQLLGLGDSVKADEVEAKLKAVRQDATRGLRDRLDLFEDGADVVRLGQHRFNVNTRPLELTLLPGDDDMVVHLTGTDFHEPVDDAEFAQTRPFWRQQLISESQDVYRAEYLAACVLADAEAGVALGDEPLTLERLQQGALGEEGLLDVVRAYAGDRYDEGYERGLHDVDAAKILAAVVSLRTTAGLLRFAPEPRAWACLFWSYGGGEAAEAQRAHWVRRARSLGRLHQALGATRAESALGGELAGAVGAFLTEAGIEAPSPEVLALAGEYLVAELAAEAPRFVTSQEAAALVDAFWVQLEGLSQRTQLEEDLAALEDRPAEGLGLVRAWLEAFVGGLSAEDRARREPVLLEAAVVVLTSEAVRGVDDGLARDVSAARLAVDVESLLGQHDRLDGRTLHLRLDEFLARLTHFRLVQVPAYRDYRQQVRALLERERARLRIDELKPRVLTSFVRNKLINDVYLHLVGDNLAKQIGAAGASKRTDLMGLLLLISPPGYGKTTLMEYVSSRLGLAFVKVNGPSLGHAITSLDPEEADHATARQEVEKVNLALEMGNNVMLYLDDIQHCHPEFLQKFISLCDGQRRIEGVWKGRTRTYDLRGKKFCVVMAGNPYTESGDKFQIPDMLANRADTYNLGEVLEGKGDLFALSYIENTITSNAVLAPLAGRDQEDIYRLIRLAQGEQIATTDFSHAYSSVELQEMVAVLQRLFAVQEVLLKVNQQYIASASMDDAYRTEPPFKLQGSYRNMNKVAEKVASAMNDEELQRLIADHYQGEAQTLTTGAEQNLLKLAQLRGIMTLEQEERWEEIKRSFGRVQLMGGSDDDPVARISGPLSGLAEHLAGLRQAVNAAAGLRQVEEEEEEAEVPPLAELVALREVLEKLDGAVDVLARPQVSVKLEQPPLRLHQEPLRLDPALVEQLSQALARAAQPAQLPVEALAAQQAEAVRLAVQPFVEQATGQLRQSQAVAQRLGELLGDYLEFERARRVRLRSPSQRLDPDEDDDGEA